jgi:hypothetical protein
MDADSSEVARLLNSNIERLAIDLLGRPSRRAKTELRFGNSGGISVMISGAKAGTWFDFRSDRGGDGIELICECKNLDRIGALNFGRGWLGLNSASGSRRSANGRHNGSGNGGAADDETDRLAKALAIERQCGPVAGTEGNDYLNFRGITSDAVRQLRNIRFNPCAWSQDGKTYCSIVFVATDDDGRTKAVQQIYLFDGQKAPLAPNPNKRTNGTLDGAACRFPGDVDTGTLILAEGPETALSIWQATKQNVWSLFGPRWSNAPVPEGTETVVIARDADPVGSQADKTVFAGAEQLACRGFRVKIASPPRYDDQQKTDFNDVLNFEGEPEVARLIAGAVDYVRPATAADPDDAAITWGEPDLGVLRLQRRDPPALPLEVFGPLWRDWIVEAAAAAACPTDYVVAPLLAAVSALIGNARWVQAAPGWSEPPFLWLCTVGDSGNGKSPGSDCLMRDVLPAIERKMIADFPVEAAALARRSGI